MATITISAADVADAQNFLEQFLSDENPDGNFGKGTALADLSVSALAAVFAYLTAENGLVQNRQSLKTLSAGVVDADPQSLLDATTALLSNWFITPKAGSYARGVAVGHTSQQVDLFIQPTHLFTRTPGAVFQVDSGGQVYYISKADLLPVFDAQGVVTEYEFRVPLVAVAIGEAYNIAPGLFSDFDKFSPYVTYIENLEKFQGGKGTETASELITRASTAVSVRNLINDRSITAVLGDTFGDTVTSVLVIGMADPEMQRDRLTGVAAHLAIHLGGAVDIYILAPVIETAFTGTIGDLFPRNDGVVSVFRDATVANFVAAGVLVGDVLRVYAGVPGAPREFLIRSVQPSQLIVSDRVPFPLATDEQTPATTVSYTIGRNTPGFNNVLSNGGAPKTTGTTSRQVMAPGHVLLPGLPILRLLDVAITDPPNGEALFKDPVDGYIHFVKQVNAAPANVLAPATPLEYQTVVLDPLVAQSAAMNCIVNVGPSGNEARYDGLHLRVRYQTLVNFTAITAFVAGRRERTVCASQLVRAHNPVRLRLALTYRLRTTATTAPDDAAIAQTIVDYINAFDASAAPIDVSAVSQVVRDAYPAIGAVFPFTIEYRLWAPTGDVLAYETLDEVVLDAAHQTDGPALDLAAFGVSSRTVRYLTGVEDVSAASV